jgi:hypothetical protein
VHALRSIIGSVLALALAAISVGCCFLFGTHLATGVEGLVYGVLGATADALKALLPLSISASLASKSRTKALIGMLLFLCFTTWSFVSELGLYSLSRDAVTSSAAGTREAYQGLKAERERIQARLKELGAARPSKAIEADIAAQRQNRLWTASEECKNASGTAARTFCAGLERLEGENAISQEAERLRNDDSKIAVKLSGMNIAEALKSADAQSEALARFTGLAPSTIRDALAVLVAALVELGSGFGLFAVSGGAARAEPVSCGQGDSAKQRPASGKRRVRKGDPVKAFLKAETLGKAGAEIAAGILHDRYEEFCKSEGETALSPTAFGRRMSELKYIRNKRGGIARYAGLALKEATPVHKAAPRLQLV